MQVALGLQNFLRGFFTGNIKLEGWDVIKLDCTKSYLFNQQFTGPLEDVVDWMDSTDHNVVSYPPELGIVQHELLFRAMTAKPMGFDACYYSAWDECDSLDEISEFLRDESPISSKYRCKELGFDSGHYGNQRIHESGLDPHTQNKYYTFLRYLISGWTKVFYLPEDYPESYTLAPEDLRAKYDNTSVHSVPQLEAYLKRGATVYYNGEWKTPTKVELPDPLTEMHDSFS